MGYGIEGKKVRLVPVNMERHMENCVRWLNDPEVTANLAIGAYPLTMAAERAYFENLEKGSKTDVVFAIETLEGRHIGMSGVHQIDMVSRTAKTGSLIGETELHGQGLGTESAKLRAKYCFDVLNLRVIYSEFLDGNEKSKRMQEKCGYRIWGVKPAAIYKNGRYYDLHETVLFREEWEKLNRP